MVNDLDTLAAAAGLGYHDYDTAIPIDWVEEVQRQIGIRPGPGFVWLTKNMTFGRPFPLTAEAHNIMRLVQLRTDAIKLQQEIEHINRRINDDDYAPSIALNILMNETEYARGRISEDALRA